MALIALILLPLTFGSELDRSESVIHSLPRLPPTYPHPYTPHGYPTTYPPPYGYTPAPFQNSADYNNQLNLEDAYQEEGSDHGQQVHIYQTYHDKLQKLTPQFQSEDGVYGPSFDSDPYYIEPILTHHHLKEYKPYHYDISITPECAYVNKRYYNITFCLQDESYPVDTIKHELERNKPLVDRILSDVTYQSADNLVDGLTRVEEEGYSYKHYYGQKNIQAYAEDYSGYSYYKDYYKQGGYVCPSDIFYGRPKRAINTYGKWKVIVNLPDEYYAKGYGVGYEKYTQTQRLEQCMYPGAPCSYIDTHYESSCLQKHNFVRLLAYTYGEGLHIDSFKLPISCSCHLTKPNHYGHYPAFLPALPHKEKNLHRKPIEYDTYGKK